MTWKIIFVLAFAVGALAQKNLSELCKKNGAEDKVEAVQNAMDNFLQCLNSFPSFRIIREEVTEALSNGSAKAVVKNRCSKSSELNACINDLYTGIKPCMPASVKDKFPAAATAATEAIDYVCYNDGSRIMSILDEGGLECYDNKFGEIGDCGEVVMDKMPDELSFRMNFFEAGCYLLDEWSNCVLTVVRSCQSPTLANVTETILRYLRTANACSA